MNKRNMPHFPPPVPSPMTGDGRSATTINVGDLWVATWGGVDLALVLVAGVFDTHVTVWLVTEESAAAAKPSFRLDADWLTLPLTCWPEAQAGMSKAALGRRVGSILTERDIRAVLVDVWESTEEANASVTYYPEEQSTQGDDALDAGCQYVSMLSDLDTPFSDPSHRGILASDFAKQNGLSTPRDLSRYLAGVPALISTAFNGERVLTSVEVNALAEAFATDISEITTHPEDPIVSALREPKWKADVTAIVHDKNIDETETRLKIWERAKVPARQADAQNDAAIDARITQAITELRSE